MTSQSLLLVDDDALDRAGIIRALGRNLYRIHELDSAQALYDYLAEHRVDCILLDYRLPQADGLQVLSVLKDRALDVVPVILLTGMEDETIAMQCIQQGAQDYLIKSEITRATLSKAITFAAQRKQLELALRQAMQAAEQASKAKSEFLANMSHELRTPLNSIIVLSDLMSQRDDIPDTVAQHADIIHKSGDDLLTLVNDLLDMAKIEAGKMTVERTLVSLKEILNDLVLKFQPLAAQKQIQFNTRMETTAPETIHSDLTRLNQVLRNLLSNAFKFTPAQGTVTLSVECRDASLIIAVTDTGVGIAPDKREAIFQAFEQADSSITRGYGGTGLGLKITRDLTALLGGAVQVTSTEGEGSCFSLHFPLSQVLPPSTETLGYEHVAADNTGGHDSPLSGIHALVVDDDDTNRMVLTKLLERYGCRVTGVNSGQQALTHFAQRQDIDILLTDIMMPGMDGRELMQHIRAQEDGQTLPILAITASAMADDQTRCLQAGANTFLAKPINATLLLQTVQELLQ